MVLSLALLGTNQQYNPNPRLEFPNGETLSLISSLIEGEHAEDSNTGHEATHVLNKSIRVIDGPDLKGKCIAHRTTEAVLAILEAVCEGTTEVNLIAYSRGCIESILAAHELERIKELLANNDLNLNSFIHSDNKETTKAMSLQKDRIAALITRLSKNKTTLDKLSLRLFCLDPVPGGRVFRVPTRWTDTRFYALPPIVSQYQQYIFENERSRGMKPIVPAVVDPEKTEFQLFTLPGHHTTGIGNFRNQQYQKSSKNT